MEKKRHSKLAWLWENMKGYRAVYMLCLVGTVTYNVMHLIVPYMSQSIIDLFLGGEQAAENLATKRNLFWELIIAMVLLTFLRTAIVYLSCMGGEVVSQKALYRIRTYLFDKIERQDMHFYATYRTGDLMTRLTGDLDAVRHMIAWVIRTIVESLALMGATAVYFFYMDWRLALCLFAIAPFIFLIIILFKNKVAPRHRALREKLAEMNTISQENISGNRVVKAFAREKYEIEKFDESNTSYSQTNQKTALTWLTYYPYVESAANLMPVVLLLVGGDYEAVHAALRPDVAETVAAEDIQSLVLQQTDGAGVYKQIESSMVTGQSSDGENYGVGVYYCQYARKKILFRVAFDTGMQLIGLEVKKP